LPSPGHNPVILGTGWAASIDSGKQEGVDMQHTDGLRRTAYAVAIATGLMAVFGWLAGSDTFAALLAVAAMAIVAIAEKVNSATARSRRDRKLGRLTGS
jgi:hypothetical protein